MYSLFIKCPVKKIYFGGILMQKQEKKFQNILHIGRGFAGKVVVLTIVMILIGTAFSAANIQNSESITVLKEQGRGITWDARVNFTNPGGQNDYVVFGEGPDARDGPPADIYDVVKPPGGMLPYIRAYLKDNLPMRLKASPAKG